MSGTAEVVMSIKRGHVVLPIDRYWDEGFDHVEGWVDSRLLAYLKLIDRIQHEAGIDGQAVEIGVFHGKLFIALACLLQSGAKATAIDVFEDQSRNIDGAGEGNMTALRRNLEAFGPRDLDYAFIKRDSTTLTVLDRMELVRDRGPFRLFSVDGCHTTEHTLADLRTAEDVLSPGGVIILDDYFQPHWPGVTQAVSLFCNAAPRVAPFLYACHKLFFVSLGWHALFAAACQAALAGQPDVKMTTMFGSAVAVVYP